MDRTDAAELAFRLAGVYAAIQAIGLVEKLALPLRTAVRSPQDRWTELLLVAGPIVVAMALFAGLAWLLIARSRRFAERTLSAPSQASIDFGSDAEGKQVVAISLFGLWLLCLSVPELLTEAAAALALGEAAWSQLRGRLPELVTPVTQFALGCWLAFAPRMVQRLWAFLARLRQVE